MRLLLTLATAAMIAPMAHAQVFKCPDATGKMVFSDRPCTAEQAATTVRATPKSAPALAPDPEKPAARLSPEAQAHEAKRAQSKAQSDQAQARSDESNKKVAAAAAEVQKIRAENANPQKCADARRKMEIMEQRDPLMHKSSAGYQEQKGLASLHCGS